MVFQHPKLLHNRVTLAMAIKEGFATAVSNGSFKDKQGTAAWMFYNSGDPSTSIGQGNSPHPVQQNPQGYQSKLAGLYRIATMTNTICNFHHILHGKILVLCDGEVVLNCCFRPWHSNPFDKQFDIIHDTMSLTGKQKSNGRVNTSMGTRMQRPSSCQTRHSGI